MNKLYRVIVKGCDVHNMAVAAIDKIHASKLVISRLKEYGLTEQEYTIQSIKRDGYCNWDLEDTIIYN